jgi:hypothetical protein
VLGTYDVLLHGGEVVGEVIDLGDVAVVLRRVVAVGHQREAEVAAAIVAAQLGDLLGDLQNVVLRAVDRIPHARSHENTYRVGRAGRAVVPLDVGAHAARVIHTEGNVQLLLTPGT